MNDDRKFANMMSQEEEARKLHNTLMHHAEEQGLKKGLKQGISNSKKEIALNMLEKNTDVNFISEVTGLSIKEIENLK